QEVLRVACDANMYHSSYYQEFRAEQTKHSAIEKELNKIIPIKLQQSQVRNPYQFALQALEEDFRYSITEYVTEKLQYLFDSNDHLEEIKKELLEEKKNWLQQIKISLLTTHKITSLRIDLLYNSSEPAQYNHPSMTAELIQTILQKMQNILGNTFTDNGKPNILKNGGKGIPLSLTKLWSDNIAILEEEHGNRLQGKIDQWWQDASKAILNEKEALENILKKQKAHAKKTRPPPDNPNESKSKSESESESEGENKNESKSKYIAGSGSSMFQSDRWTYKFENTAE
ncbi:unnamed protein product, partial [marine sediment metagenome]